MIRIRTKREAVILKFFLRFLKHRNLSQLCPMHRFKKLILYAYKILGSDRKRGFLADR
jgi:hypothetical protein